MIYIVNFNNSRNLADIKYDFDNGGQTNIDILLDEFLDGNTTWSVPKNATPGDVVVFMCAKTARDNLGLATSHIPASYGREFINWVDKEKSLYKQYSGNLMGYGVIVSKPIYDSGSNWWYADIENLQQFPNPIHIDDFRSFITIAKTNSITPITDEQWERLKWTVNQKNKGFFQNVVAPDISTIIEEFEDAVKKEETKPLSTLEKEAKKKVSKPTVSTVQTKVYHRDPTIAAYVKKRAKGVCQLCGQPAAFNDADGEPYLECHHIKWLSQGGMDSDDNCVALCPNCHKKMHIVNDTADINKLLSSISNKNL